MLKRATFALLAGFAASAAAQVPARPDPADPKAAVQPPFHESAFKGYRPYVEPEVAGWRSSNEEMGRLGGHMGHLPKAQNHPPKSAGKPPAQGGPGSQK